MPVRVDTTLADCISFFSLSVNQIQHSLLQFDKTVMIRMWDLFNQRHMNKNVPGERSPWTLFHVAAQLVVSFRAAVNKDAWEHMVARGLISESFNRLLRPEDDASISGDAQISALKTEFKTLLISKAAGASAEALSPADVLSMTQLEDKVLCTRLKKNKVSFKNSRQSLSRDISEIDPDFRCVAVIFCDVSQNSSTSLKGQHTKQSKHLAKQLMSAVPKAAPTGDDQQPQSPAPIASVKKSKRSAHPRSVPISPVRSAGESNAPLKPRSRAQSARAQSVEHKLEVKPEGEPKSDEEDSAGESDDALSSHMDAEAVDAEAVLDDGDAVHEDDDNAHAQIDVSDPDSAKAGGEMEAMDGQIGGAHCQTAARKDDVRMNHVEEAQEPVAQAQHSSASPLISAPEEGQVRQQLPAASPAGHCVPRLTFFFSVMMLACSL